MKYRLPSACSTAHAARANTGVKRNTKALSLGCSRSVTQDGERFLPMEGKSYERMAERSKAGRKLTQRPHCRNVPLVSSTIGGLVLMVDFFSLPYHPHPHPSHTSFIIHVNFCFRMRGPVPEGGGVGLRMLFCIEERFTIMHPVKISCVWT